MSTTGVCARDIKCYTGAALFWGDEHRVDYCRAPVTVPENCTDPMSPSPNYHCAEENLAHPIARPSKRQIQGDQTAADSNQLCWGRVGTDFSEKLLRSLFLELNKIRVEECHFFNLLAAGQGVDCCRNEALPKGISAFSTNAC